MTVQVVQHRVSCTVKPNDGGGECLIFSFTLGPIKFVCIGNIPGEGQKQAPGYVKIMFDDSRSQWSEFKSKVDNI